MQIKQLTITLIALLILVSSAGSAFAAIEVTGDVYAGVNSMYLWRGDNLSNDDPVVQGGMDISIKNFTLSYWSNLNLNTDELDETDFTIDYTQDLNDKLSLSVGHIFYALDSLDDTSEVYAGISLKTLLEPTFTIYYDYDANAGDIFITAAISHSLELAKGLNLNMGGLISYLDSDNVSDLHNLELSAAADYAITDQLTLTPSLIYSTPLSDNSDDFAYGDGIDEEVMGSLALSFSF